MLSERIILFNENTNQIIKEMLLRLKPLGNRLYENKIKHINIVRYFTLEMPMQNINYVLLYA